MCSHSEIGAIGRHRHIEEEDEGTDDTSATYISIEMLGMIVNVVHDKLFGIAWLQEANEAIKSEEMQNL